MNPGTLEPWNLGTFLPTTHDARARNSVLEGPGIRREKGGKVPEADGEEGRQAAKRRGVSFGRPQKLRSDQKTLVLALVQEGKSISAVARTFNVHPATIHRCLNAPQTANPPL